MTHKISNKFITVTVDTLGAEVISVKDKKRREYIWSGEAWKGHAPLLFPVCGSVRDDKYTLGGKEYPIAKHGFARRSEFTVESQRDFEIILSLSSNEETRKQYPFDFKLTARYAVDGPKLYVNFTVENKGEDVMPYMFGWHPAFKLPGKAPINDFFIDFGQDGPLTVYPLQNGPFVSTVGVNFPLESGCYRLNEQQIYENDTLILKGVNGHSVIGGGGYPPFLELNYSRNLPYFCIWKAPVSSARYICLEPWSGVPTDGTEAENFDTREMLRLEGGKEATFNYDVFFIPAM
jgi:galactose mutarotase-like enzyme